MLVVVGPEEMGRVFHLDEGTYLLGRSEAADFRLSLETISRKHARITVEDDTVTIQDLGSRCGTFVDNRRVESSKVKPGSRIVVGGIMLKLVGAA